MKLPSFAASLAVAVAVLSTGIAAPINTESRITAVTVYSDRAVVTRAATVNVSSTGPAELTFDRLPASLLDQYLQVSGRGTAQATLLDVAARATYVDFTPNERVKALEDDLRALAHQDRLLSDRSVVLAQQRDYVLKIQNATTSPAKDVATTAPSADTWIKLLAFSEDQLTKLATETQSVDAQREDLQAKRTALEQQLNQLHGEGGRSFKTVTVRLAAASTGAFEIILRYTVPAASWTPMYDARVLSTERAVQLGYFGLVRQNTGEDWQAVDLTLSTARPSLGGSPPSLTPWTVDVRQALPVPVPMQFGDNRLRKETSAKEALVLSSFATGSTPAEFPEIREATVMQAQFQAQATSASFRIPVLTTVVSDNAAQKVPITAVRLAASPEYLAIPKQLPAAFLTSKVTNSSDFPLLAGAMNVFLDDAFVASSALRSVMPGEKFDLALGVDEGITVKRKLNNRFAEDTGVMTKGKRVTYDYTLTVQNNKKTAEKIILLDQVPVSRHEKIVLKIISPDEREAKPDAEGTLKWTLSLNPGEKRDLPLKFSVEHPADLAVTGLE